MLLNIDTDICNSFEDIGSKSGAVIFFGSGTVAGLSVRSLENLVVVVVVVSTLTVGVVLLIDIVFVTKSRKNGLVVIAVESLTITDVVFAAVVKVCFLVEVENVVRLKAAEFFVRRTVVPAIAITRAVFTTMGVVAIGLVIVLLNKVTVKELLIEMTVESLLIESGVESCAFLLLKLV